MPRSFTSRIVVKWKRKWRKTIILTCRRNENHDENSRQNNRQRPEYYRIPAEHKVSLLRTLKSGMFVTHSYLNHTFRSAKLTEDYTSRDIKQFKLLQVHQTCNLYIYKWKSQQTRTASYMIHWHFLIAIKIKCTQANPGLIFNEYKR
jgi:hypothetical protein